MNSHTKEAPCSAVVLTKEMRAALKAVRKSTEHLQSMSLSPLPVLASAPLGRTCEERIKFVEACFRWHKGVYEAFGFRETSEQPFPRSSVLGSIFEAPGHLAQDVDLKEPVIAPVEFMGEPPESLLSVNQPFGGHAQGLAALTRENLREALEEGLTSLMNRLCRFESTKPLIDGELRFIALHADHGAMVDRERWNKIYVYLRDRLTRDKRCALELVEWTESRLKRVGSVAKRVNNTWVAKALRLIRQAEAVGTSLKLADLASVVGKDESTVYRKFPDYFARGHHPRGSLPTAILDDSGTIQLATIDKLPARRSRGKGRDPEN